MKSIESIRSEKQKLIDRRDEIFLEREITPEMSKEVKSARRRIQFLNLCEFYLETSPEETFIKSEIEKLTNIVSVLNERIADAHHYRMSGQISKDDCDARILEIQKPYKVNHVMKQIKTLRFLLR